MRSIPCRPFGQWIVPFTQRALTLSVTIDDHFGDTVGPITLFDKSFLQALSVDESVWFDHFFLPVICPLFFVATLADLTKQQRSGSSRTPEDEVRVIADKTPVLSGVPCVHHSQLCIANLLGHQAPHFGQIPLAGGRPVRGAGGKPGGCL